MLLIAFPQIITKIHKMKKYIIFSLTAWFTVSLVVAGDKKIKSLPTNYDYNAIEDYFLSYLNGDTTAFHVSYALKTDDINAVVNKV